MSYLYTLFSESVIEAMGWTIFHSLWQGTLIAVVLLTVIAIFKNLSAQFRYLLSFMALIAILLCSVLTFASAYNYAELKYETRVSLLNNPAQVKEMVKASIIEEGETSAKIKPQRSIRKAKFRGFLQRNYPVVFVLWMVGVFVFLIKMIGGLFYVNSLRNRLVSELPESFLATISKFSEKLNLRKRVNTLQSGFINTPMVIGFIKPIILLPVSLITNMSVKEVDAIIAHELAHIKRHDYLLNIFQSIVETLFFYHPAVWLVSKSIRDERENSCDEIAISLTNDKVSYLKALTHSQSLFTNTSNQKVAFSGSKGSLLQRAIKIQNFSTMKKNVTEGFIAATIVFVGLILLSFSFDNQNLKNDYSQLDTGLESRGISDSDRGSLQSETSALQDSTKYAQLKDVEELEVISEEMEQLMEIAYSENNSELANLIAESINLAMHEVKIADIMHEVDSSLKAANINQEIQLAMHEAKKELKEEHNDSLQIAIEALELASATIEAINVEEVVSMALQTASMAIESIDLAGIMEMALQEASLAMEGIDMEQIMKEAMEAEKVSIQFSDEQDFKFDDFEDSDQKNQMEGDEEKINEMEEKLREIEK